MGRLALECHSVRKRKATISRIRSHDSGDAGYCDSLETVTVPEAEQNPHAIMTRILSMASIGKVLCTRRFLAILAIGGTPCITLTLGATSP